MSGKKDDEAPVSPARMRADFERLFHERQQRRSRWPQDAHGHVDTRAAMVTLGKLFPTLASGVPGIDPFDAETLLRWLASGAPTGGSRRAALFLLHVWNARADYVAWARELGLASDAIEPFNLSEALGVWDLEHRQAFLTWAEAPFWP